ncbi:MAG TPA: hypothetical protein PK067_00760 [Kaistella chaponensis]|jgi:hypothetical protein|uniref:Uncharacterized protein n=1 Tax=Kaistella chaponensis TaxID=713588 RepID=A0A1N7NLC6_9FLAO|nr:hypothetical protein [Kaistella chaponensis]SIS98979.1 hypothetical protein SAMN05421789_11565 [Kaistella chaponensis]HPW87765.1 hypothetical protein [Kaistella chaponensis]HQC05532.1 hypothetical protein [Kaistella chaponensis]
MANLTNNRLNIVATEAQITAAKNSLVQFDAQFPFLIGLTVEEKTTLPAINVDNKIFTEDAINAAVNNMDMLPGYLSVSGVQTDMKLFNQLDELVPMVRKQLEKLEDTRFLAGSEAYTTALMIYKLFGAAAESGIPGADAIVAQLRERFTSNGNTPNNPPVNPNP